MAAEHFCLRWNNHQSTLVSVFDDLLESGTLVDCTLAADGQYLKAHKVVLSACSPYLGMLLSQHYDMHPIIILKDVKYEELKAMLDYMYRGEVNISQEQLSAFLKTAESLKIKGLTDTGGTVDESICKQQGRPPSSSESTTSAPVDEPSSPQTRDGECGSPAPKRRKRSRVSQSDDSSNQAISENRSENSCDRASRNEYSGSGVNNHKASRSEYDVNSVKPEFKEEPSESGHYEDEDHNVDDSDGAEEAQKAGPSNGASSGIKGTSWHLSADSTGDETQLSATQDESENSETWGDHALMPLVTMLSSSPHQSKNSTKKFSCNACGKTYMLASSLYTHEKYQCGKEPQFKCPYCPHKTKLKGNLKAHIGFKHSDMPRPF